MILVRNFLTVLLGGAFWILWTGLIAVEIPLPLDRSLSFDLVETLPDTRSPQSLSDPFLFDLDAAWRTARLVATAA